MKRRPQISILFFLIVVLCCSVQCKKDSNTVPRTIILYDKPLFIIQPYIQGNWKLHYGKGGIVSTMIQYYNNTFWNFTSGNKIKASYNGIITADATIRWYHDVGTYTNGATTFILSFSDKQGVPWNYVVERIYNDTLILHDNAVDAVFYHFTK